MIEFALIIATSVADHFSSRWALYSVSSTVGLLYVRIPMVHAEYGNISNSQYQVYGIDLVR